MANRRTPGEAIFHSNVVEEKDQLARCMISQASARELERYVASEVISRIDILESAALIRTSHSEIVGSMEGAYLCAAEHLRGVASEEGDRLDRDESRQVDELLNLEDLIFRSRLPSSVEVGQCSRVGEDQCFDSVSDNGEHIPSNCAISGMVLESHGCVRVVCRSTMKIFEKLKSLCSLSRLLVVFWRRSRRNSVINLGPRWDQGSVLSTENQADTWGILDSTGQDSSEPGGLGMMRADLTALPRLSRTGTCRGGGQ